jgi:Flp pilus assembly pilin Flp
MTGQNWSHWWHSDEAQDIAEYAVLIAVVLVIVLATATVMGTNVHTVISKAAAVLTSK